jgi:F-type H+-transporting ATPase subunit a
VQKKKLLGCSFPVIIVIAVVLLLLILITFAGGPIGSKLLKLVGIDFQLPGWMAIEKPAPELAAEPLFHIGSFPVTNTLLTAWISIAILIVFAAFATRKMKLVPSRLQAALELVITTLLNLCESIAGPKYGRQVFPIVATIFLFVFVNAWTSLIPGYGSIMVAIMEHGETIKIPLLRGANTDINIPAALAVVAFITAWAFGIKAHGFKFFKQFIQTGKIGLGIKQLFQGKMKSALGNIMFGIIDLFVGFLELLSQFIRLVSFTFRLFGNMTAGEILLLSISFLVPWVLSIAIYGLEMLVGFVQALAFSLLTLIFTSLAVAGHEEEGHEEKAAH